jgi:hypothetical protein
MQLGHLASGARSPAPGAAVDARAVSVGIRLHLDVGRIRCLTGKQENSTSRDALGEMSADQPHGGIDRSCPVEAPSARQDAAGPTW